ncbi:MAG: aldehyde ferredoxin oxidoreductase family protein [Chloroflexota bacterium]|jgi:aldehyde:ferredoxin oxidoreductase
MSYGFMGRILKVDLSSGTISQEALRQDWAREYIGGAGLATRYLYERSSPGVDPLGPLNPLIFMTGPLTGTASASASRYSVVSLSPLTRLWGQANSGGDFGPGLKSSGYDGVIFEGVSSAPVYLSITDGVAELRPADHLWGKTVPETEDILQQTLDGKVSVACIGPAGENLVRYAAIMNNKHRAAGRCGLGAVMGAKRLKAIACHGNAPAPLANKRGFSETARRQFELLDESILKVGFEAFGTNMVSDMVNVRGGYPTRNWQLGEFEEIEEVNAEGLSDKVLVKGVKCFACPIACGRGTEIRDGKWAGHHGEGPEYETTNMFGAMCGVSDMNAITMANYRCNEYGLDTITTGSTIAFAMECYERGILTDEQTGGQRISFGDSDLIVDLVGRIAYREGVGDLLADGTRIVSQRLGQDSERFAMQVKGLELPAYDPRAAKITGLGYVTANRGGDHMTGYVQGPTFVDVPFLLVEESSIKDPFVADPDEVKVLADLEDALAVLDAVGGCKFMGILLTAEDIAGLIANATGWDLDVEEFRRSGERIFNLARALCVREGVGRNQDVLPRRLLEEPLPAGPAEGMVIDTDTLEMMKDAYYRLRGWDLATGIPEAEKLADLGLEYLIEEMWGAGEVFTEPNRAVA